MLRNSIDPLNIYCYLEMTWRMIGEIDDILLVYKYCKILTSIKSNNYLLRDYKRENRLIKYVIDFNGYETCH